VNLALQIFSKYT